MNSPSLVAILALGLLVANLANAQAPPENAQALPVNAQAVKEDDQAAPENAPPVKDAAPKDEATDGEVEGLTFREPFSGLSASETESKLIVFLITDEDPFAWTKAKLDQADKNRLGGGPDVWCGREFRRSFQKLFVSRPDLKDRCIAQRVVAGLPFNLTGGVRRTLPPRAMVAICDGNYRLASLAVGVPEPDDLLRLIEDAQENLTLLELHEGDPAKMGAQILDRTNSRVRRVYSESLTRLAEQMRWDETLSPIDDAWIAKYATFIADLNPSYLFDVQLRFGLSDTSDLIRLIVLEQHTETRRDWCDTIAPYIVGRPMRELMNPLIDTTWGFPVVVNADKSQHQETLRWFSTRRDNAIVVLAIKPTYLDRNIVWPPPSVSRNPLAKLDWNALETAMSHHAFRTVSTEELAVLLRESDELPINLLSPVRARYLIFQPGKKRIEVIRENDLPGKFLKRLEKD